MRNSHDILLPASVWFITTSLVIAFILNLLPWGQWVWVPDFVALVLAFWSIHEPRKIGISIAFAMGLLMDVHGATLLGEHALAYTLLSYFSITIHRRVLWFSLGMQALHVLPLLLLTQAVQLIVRFIVSAQTPSWYYFSESIICAALWPFVSGLLLAPQRRVINRDDNRPI